MTCQFLFIDKNKHGIASRQVCNIPVHMPLRRQTLLPTLSEVPQPEIMHFFFMDRCVHGSGQSKHLAP